MPVTGRAPAGYSGTPLPKKLGIKPDSRVAVLIAPDGWVAEHLSAISCDLEAAAGPYDVILWFLTTRAELERGIGPLADRLTAAGGLWVAWPKKASKRPTDLTEDVLREVALPLGVVDNKVCAVDETWSGLRFVWRKENRAGRGS